MNIVDVIKSRINDVVIKSYRGDTLTDEDKRILSMMKIIKLAETRNVPQIHVQKIMLDKIIQNEAFKMVNDKLEEIKSGKWVVLSGNVGTGKSFLASYIALKLPLEYKVTFIKSFNVKSVNLDKYDAVVIDDLGYLDDDNMDVIKKNIENMYDRNKQLIITTNLSKEQLKSKLGERIYDRFRERAIIFTLTGKSIRKEVRDE